MLTSIEGMYRNGKIELVNVPLGIPENTPVIITFLESIYLNLPSRGIDEEQAADLRGRLATFAKEWDSPEMDMYHSRC